MRRTLRLATRSSPLAVAQAEQVAALLKGAGYETALVEIARSEEAGSSVGHAAGEYRRSDGSDVPPVDKGRFVRGVEQALTDRRADIAVHSAKDLPSDLLPGLILAGAPPRVTANDAWVPASAHGPDGPAVGSLKELPTGARIGTASHRRRSQLLALRPDLVVEELRGNIDTRLALAAERGLDGAVLAAAGLQRLGREEAIAFVLDPAEEMLPAAGQGTLALEVREDDEEVREAVAAINDPVSLAELKAERALVAALEADCDTPVAARAVVEGDRLTLDAYAGASDGSDWIRDRLTGSNGEAEKVGRQVAERMSAAGAREVMRR